MAIVGKGATIGKQYWVARDIQPEVEVSIKMIDGRLVVIGLFKDKYRRFSTYSCYDQFLFYQVLKESTRINMANPFAD